ncbi:MAG: hypothetical protein AAGJ18_20995 [Bacteroidota bacterium]
MQKFILALTLLLLAVNLNAQMLSKETGQSLAPNQRILQPPTPSYVLEGQKFASIPNQQIKIENATPTTGNTCRMQSGGTFAYVMQYDSLRALMIYEHPSPSFNACKVGVTFLMPIDEVFQQKKLVDPNAIEIKKRMIRKNMQRDN